MTTLVPASSNFMATLVVDVKKTDHPPTCFRCIVYGQFWEPTTKLITVMYESTK